MSWAFAAPKLALRRLPSHVSMHPALPCLSFCLSVFLCTAEFYEGHLPCHTPGKDDCNMAASDPRRGPRIAWPKDTTCTAQVRMSRTSLYRNGRNGFPSIHSRAVRPGVLVP
jgi:hypothetical protein